MHKRLQKESKGDCKKNLNQVNNATMSKITKYSQSFKCFQQYKGKQKIPIYVC